MSFILWIASIDFIKYMSTGIFHQPVDKKNSKRERERERERERDVPVLLPVNAFEYYIFLLYDK